MVNETNLMSDNYSNTRIRILTELVLYAYLLYSLTSVNFGFYVPYVAVIMLFISAIFSGLVGLGYWTKSIVFYLLLVTSVLFVVIQIFIFHLDIYSGYVQPFLYWVVFAIIVFPLSKDDAFLKRLALVIALAFLIQIPFLTPTLGARVDRLTFPVGSTGVDNANDLAAWLGFCFVIFWMWLWGSQWRIYFIVLISIAFGVLIMLLSTITRGALIGILLAILIYVRNVTGKKRFAYFCGLLALAAIVWIIPYTRGIILEYQARLFEDTGRAALLNMGWNAFKIVPFWGYGADNIYFRLSMESTVGPHNPFLLIGLGGGYIPLIAFCLFWLSLFIQLIRQTTKPRKGLDKWALFAYVAFVSMLLNTIFSSIWVVSVLFFVSRTNRDQEPVPLQAITSLREQNTPV